MFYTWSGVDFKLQGGNFRGGRQNVKTKTFATLYTPGLPNLRPDNCVWPAVSKQL